jgi:hypothetical protein
MTSITPARPTTFHKVFVPGLDDGAWSDLEGRVMFV